MASVERFLERRLKLKINRAKSAVAPRRSASSSGSAWREERHQASHRPASHSPVQGPRAQDDRRTRGASLEKIVEGLSRYLVGWRGYFGFCETPSVLRALEQWIRRRLRSIVWKQWRRGRTRYAELRRGAWGAIWRRKPPEAPTVPGGSATAPRLPSRFPTTTSAEPSASLPSPRPKPHNQPNRRVRTYSWGHFAVLRISAAFSCIRNPISRFGLRFGAIDPRLSPAGERETHVPTRPAGWPASHRIWL